MEILIHPALAADPKKVESLSNKTGLTVYGNKLEANRKGQKTKPAIYLPTMSKQG